VNLACGENKCGGGGIDCHLAPEADYVCDPSFETISLANNCADKTPALAFFVHLPAVITHFKEMEAFSDTTPEPLC